jgi:hypothetical protein
MLNNKNNFKIIHSFFYCQAENFSDHPRIITVKKPAFYEYLVVSNEMGTFSTRCTTQTLGNKLGIKQSFMVIIPAS